MNFYLLRILAVTITATFAGPGAHAQLGVAPDLLRWHRYAEPVFPLQLANTHVIDGSASIVFTFDDSGRITDRIVTAASHPAFALAVLEAAQQWHIDTREMVRRVRRETLRFDFHRSGALIALTNRDATKGAFSPYIDSAATALTTCGEGELDRPLQTITPVLVKYPPVLKERGVRGRATVSFIVDAEGRVRVPAVIDAGAEEFGEAALSGLREGTFVPPQRRGLPVLVMVERTIVFGPVGAAK